MYEFENAVFRKNLRAFEKVSDVFFCFQESCQNNLNELHLLPMKCVQHKIPVRHMVMIGE